MELITEVEQELASKASNAVIHKLFLELDRLANKDEINDEWFEDVFEAFTFIKNIETGFGHAKAYALFLIKTHWLELPYEIRRKYGFEFMLFAQLVTGKDISTINNNLRTAELWLSKKINPGHAIRVVDRDTNKKPLPSHHYVEFDPYTIDLSKLLLVNSRAEKGEIPDRIWEMLVDDTFSCSDVQQELRGNPEPSEEPQNYWYCEGSLLIYKQGLERTIVAELNFAAYETDQNVKDAVDKLLSILSIRLDDFYIYEEFKKEFVT